MSRWCVYCRACPNSRMFLSKRHHSVVKPYVINYNSIVYSIFLFFYQCDSIVNARNIRNIIFKHLKQYLPPVTQRCIVVCYESARFQVDNHIVALERAKDTSS